jgi:uncharacterized membrane protein YedE/YeeE
MHVISALFAGLLFGFGLAISGMTQPGKVLSFLDFTGAWDPSLAFVMGGALRVFAPAYFIVKSKREKPLFTIAFDLPTKTKITPKLVVGAAIFGAGWGLAGFCPGTAITSLPTGSTPVLTLVVGVFLGILATWGAQSALAHEDPVPVQADF